MSKIAAEAPETPVPQFTIEQLLREKSGIERDIWSCALKPGEQYTIKQAEEAVKAYMKKEVK